MTWRRACLLALVLIVVCLPPSARAAIPEPVPSADETAPVATGGDSADDPAIWVHPTDPARSLVIANNKRGALESYDLDGNRVQRITDPEVTFWGNVDVRQGVTIGGVVQDVVAVYHRGLQLYRVDPATMLMTRINEGTAIASAGEGLCLYDSPSGRVYAVLIAISGQLRQFEIRDVDGDGLLDGTLVRQFAVGSEAEGCVADDDTGALYVSEENVALWEYDAEPTGGATRTAVDTIGAGDLVNDLEGVTLVDLPDGGGYVIVSVQNAADPNNSYFVAYDRLTHAQVRTFRVGVGTESDDCDRTDGITALYGDLGPSYPSGLFVCQDNNNDAPGSVGNQNLKYVPLQDVVDLGDEPPPPVGISHVATSVVNANALAWSRTVPATVQPGDGMLLSFSRSASTDALTGPGSGWTQVAHLADGSLETTHWQRVATVADAGSPVRLSYPSGYRKGVLSLSVYRGTRASVPFASAAGAVEPGTTAAHRTPTVTVPAGGAWRVSYWADRNSLAAGWTPPPGEQVRALSAGSGGGRIGVLVTDPGEPVPAGTTGGLVATSASASDKATSWTILLLP
ncbi:phytase [Nocardioides albidus]|nr:phytase [Nocardioides albidus]